MCRDNDADIACIGIVNWSHSCLLDVDIDVDSHWYRIEEICITINSIASYVICVCNSCNCCEHLQHQIMTDLCNTNTQFPSFHDMNLWKGNEIGACW